MWLTLTQAPFEMAVLLPMSCTKAFNNLTLAIMCRMCVVCHFSTNKRFEIIVFIVQPEFFELISKAQSNRADDQRGLLNKSDLVLPEFLRLDTEADVSNDNLNSTPISYKTRPRSKENGSALSASHQSQSLDSAVNTKASRRALMPPNRAPRNTATRNQPPFSSSLSPIPHTQKGGSSGITDWRSEGGGQALEEEEGSADLTFVAEGDITSPNSSLLPQSPMPLPPSPDRLHLTGEGTYQDGWARSGTSPVWTNYTSMCVILIQDVCDFWVLWICCAPHRTRSQNVHLPMYIQYPLSTLMNYWKRLFAFYIYFPESIFK